MNFFNKIANSKRYPLGFEWPLLKKTPWVFLIGTILICSPILAIYISNHDISAAQYQIIYECLGLLLPFWFFVGVIALACIIIIIMKGPGYVADAYDLPKEAEDKTEPHDSMD